jgi:RNase P subunit RPR2
MKKPSKSEAEKQIKGFFEEIKDKSVKEVKKLKKLAMSESIPLKGLRKAFCKKCLTPFENPKVRIKKGIKIVTCKKCGYLNRWKMKK